MAELGFRLSLWNGGDAGFSAAIGLYSPKLSNNAILSLPTDGGGIGKDALRDLLGKLVAAFEPERGVVTSHQVLKEHGARKPWEVGWITYERRTGLKDHNR